MNSTTPAIKEMARRLIALEVPRDASPGAGGREATRVCEKLRSMLAKFAGVAGYHALISRAVAMAKAEAPSLEAVQVRLDGSLEGLDEIEHKDAEAGAVVVVQLLSLLVTFIGESPTLRLVRDAWPHASLDKMDSRAEEQS